MYQSFRAMLLGILLSKTVSGQACDPTNPFGANCDSSEPAIAIDAELHLCNMVLTQCPGGFPAAQSNVQPLILKPYWSIFCLGCVDSYCQTGCADQKNCCSSSDPRGCFQASSGTGTSANSNANSNTGSVTVPTGDAQCTFIAKQISDCESSTSGFSRLPNSVQASCFCFNQDGSYNGTVWDNAATTCYQALMSETVGASRLSAYNQVVVGACTKFVDPGVLGKAGVKTGATAATASSTPASPTAAQTSSGASATAATTSATRSGGERVARGDLMPVSAALVIGFYLAFF